MELEAVTSTSTSQFISFLLFTNKLFIFTFPSQIHSSHLYPKFYLATNHSFFTKYFDFPRATTPAPPLPERTHPKHARAQSLGQQISTKTNTVSSTARRAKSTFTSPKHQIAILPTHVEKPISTAPSTAFTSSTTSTSTANTSIPLISPPPPSSSSSAPNSPHSRTRKTKRNASVSSNSKSISSITSPSGRVRLAITPRGEPKQIMHPLHTASSSSSSHPTAPTPVTIPQTTSTPVTPQSTLAAPHPWPTESSQSHTPASHSSIAPSTPEPFFSHFHPPEPTPLNAPTTNDPTQPTHQITPFDDPS